MDSLRIETLEGGTVERIVLNRPKANILDEKMVAAIREHLAGVSARPALRLLLFEGEGRHFSFGASVAEHLPDKVDSMLPGFHELFRELERTSIPTAALVRGQCLGGGAELATWCGRVFATPDARIGFPEIQLGVFPPIAALALRWRVGGRQATELVITGAALRADAAHDAGLVDEVCDDPEAAWRGWYAAHLKERSAAALRAAWRAARRPLQRGLDEELPVLERLYLEELMAHPDPTEGLTAFLERRAPQWQA